VSESDNCHCAGTTKVAVKVMGRNAGRWKPWGDLGKQTLWCGRDMLGQTVPSTDSNREGPITDGRQPCTAGIQRQWARKQIEGVSGPRNRPWRRVLSLQTCLIACPHWWLAEFGDCRRIWRLSPKPATVAEFGDKLSPKSATIVSSVDRA